MRIAMFNPQGNFDNKDSYWTQHPDFGGQLVYVKELAKALDRQDHEVVIFTRYILDENWPEFSLPEEVYEGTQVQIIRIPFGGDAFLEKESLWPFLHEYAQGVVRWYDQKGGMPEIVLTHYGDGGIAGAMFQNVTGIPFTFTAHSLGAQKLEKLLKRREDFDAIDGQYKFVLRLAAERAAMEGALLRIVSTAQEKDNQYMHDLYSDLFIDSVRRPFKVIPPGVNQSLFSPEEGPADQGVKVLFQQCLERDIQPDRHALPMAIASSRLEPKKNVTGLVEAYAKSLEWQYKGNLMIAVRGLDDPWKDYSSLKAEEQEQMERILSIIHHHNISGKVAFINLASQAALGAAYRETARRGGIFCLTSLYEPFGLATIEAMSCGLPVVVTANGGGQEILCAGGEVYGTLVNPEDANDIASGAVELLSSEYKRAAIINKGLQRVRSTYTWEAAAKAYVDAIKQCLKTGKPMKGREQNRVPMLPAVFLSPSQENMNQLDWLRQAILKGAASPAGS